ncbi:hypothetical protein Hypma_004499 [Hypsizygus marmoreus]|uniref:Uncharacterized protein n=1 Tax=Hypsizygus marmoreus TaxID=39966 RepID=A0A369JY25_HYPMA|nr:hypothetical protein Hypma_004499 [Hypsizygus marmoreus]
MFVLPLFTKLLIHPTHTKGFLCEATAIGVRYMFGHRFCLVMAMGRVWLSGIGQIRLIELLYVIISLLYGQSHTLGTPTRVFIASSVLSAQLLLVLHSNRYGVQVEERTDIHTLLMASFAAGCRFEIRKGNCAPDTRLVL